MDKENKTIKMSKFQILNLYNHIVFIEIIDLIKVIR